MASNGNGHRQYPERVDLGLYVLDGKVPVHVEDTIEWAKAFEKCDRRVTEEVRDGVRVSTVFLGIDHAWENGPPLLFETMTFGEGWEGEHQIQERCSTWEDAEIQHRNVCLRVWPRRSKS